MQEISKENLNTETNSVSNKETHTELNIDVQKDTKYLNLFCKDISKINNKDECGWTPLYRTVVSGILEATEVLLNSGADPNIQTTMGETPLYQAVEMGKISHVNLLLQKGANPNISQIDGLSPLHLAVNRQNILIIKELLKYKADPNTTNILYKQTPLHFAIKNNVDPMILLILVQYNGSLTMKDKFGKRPLDYVSSEEMKKVIEKLKYENDKENENNEIIEKKKIKYSTPNKEIKWSDSKMLSDSIKREYEIQETQVNYNGNVILKEPGNYYQHFYRVKSGTINNEEYEALNIRKRLFKEKYNKKLFNKSFYNIKYKNERRYPINTTSSKYKHINKEIFTKIKNNILLSNKIPIDTTPSIKNDFDDYNTFQYEEEKSILSQKTYNEGFQINKRKKLNIPLLPLAKQIKYKNHFYFSDKDNNKSTCINSENSIISELFCQCEQDNQPLYKNDSSSLIVELSQKEIPQIKPIIKFVSTKQQTPSVNFLQKKTKLKHNDSSIDSENSNNGRWTKEEQKRFAEAVLKYGNDWKKIQNHISSRNLTQVRSHAQKFLMKLKEKDNIKKFGLDQNLNWTKTINFLMAKLNYDELKNILFSVEQFRIRSCKKLKMIKITKKNKTEENNENTNGFNKEFYNNEIQEENSIINNKK